MRAEASVHSKLTEVGKFAEGGTRAEYMENKNEARIKGFI